MKKLLILLSLIMIIGCVNKPDNLVEVPEFVNLSNSPLYNGENPRYIYKIDDDVYEEVDYIEDYE